MNSSSVRGPNLALLCLLVCLGCAGNDVVARQDAGSDTGAPMGSDAEMPDATPDGTVPDGSVPDGAVPDGALDTGPADICGNGVDDDENGLIDDGCSCADASTQPCYPGDAMVLGVGACVAGTQTCIGAGDLAGWGECVGAVLPSEDLCGDGIDQDCNGVLDDGPECCSEGMVEGCYDGPPATEGVGICSAGTRSCVSGTFGACTDQKLPADNEFCDNGLDDNCNGATDELCGGSTCPFGDVPTCCGNVAGGDMSTCNGNLIRFVSLCEDAGMTWVGDRGCSIGGSPSCDSCLGGNGCCM